MPPEQSSSRIRTLRHGRGVSDRRKQKTVQTPVGREIVKSVMLDLDVGLL